VWIAPERGACNVDLRISAEQDAIISSTSDFLAAEMPLSELRQRASSPASFDRRQWARGAGLGWFSLGLSEADGGAGGTLADEALVFREIGRALAPGPFMATVIGARLAARSGHTELLHGIVDGSTVIGLAQAATGATVTVGSSVAGTFDLVDAAGTDLVLVAGDGHLALVDTTAFGEPSPAECLDPFVRLARAEVPSVPARCWAPAEDGDVADRASLLVSAMQVGIAEATCAMAVAYAVDRVQFGRPIGANQAIKHRCADMAVRVEAARWQLLFAALCCEDRRVDAPLQVAAARAIADDAAVTNAHDNIQVHGGIGYTYEHDANLYMRRANVLARLLGHPQGTLTRLAHLPVPAEL